MVQPGFSAIASAIRDLAVGEAVILERLGAAGVDTAALWTRNGRAVAGAVVLEDLAAQEPLVRELIRVGALVDFPTYTPLIPRLEPGATVLLRARVEEVHVSECRVAVMCEAERIFQKVWVHRGDVVGIEKARPEVDAEVKTRTAQIIAGFPVT